MIAPPRSRREGHQTKPSRLREPSGENHGRPGPARYNEDVDLAAKPNLFGLGRAALGELVSSLREPAYRATQIYTWLYRRRVRSIAEMTDLTKSLRDSLAASHDLRWPTVIERGHSRDGTIKYLFRLDG